MYQGSSFRYNEKRHRRKHIKRADTAMMPAFLVLLDKTVKSDSLYKFLLHFLLYVYRDVFVHIF